MTHKARRFLTFVATLMGLSFFATATPALAACAPTLVEVRSSGLLLVACNSVGYIAFSSSPETACDATVQSIDVIKSYLILAQSALLAGKSINIATTSCGATTNVITAMNILK